MIVMIAFCSPVPHLQRSGFLGLWAAGTLQHLVSKVRTYTTCDCQWFVIPCDSSYDKYIYIYYILYIWLYIELYRYAHSIGCNKLQYADAGKSHFGASARLIWVQVAAIKLHTDCRSHEAHAASGPCSRFLAKPRWNVMNGKQPSAALTTCHVKTYYGINVTYIYI